MEDRPFQVFEKREHLFVALNMTIKLLQPRVPVQRLELSLYSLELARRKSALAIEGGGPRHTVLIHPGASVLLRHLGVWRNVHPVKLYV